MLTIPMSKDDLSQAVAEAVRQNPYEDAYIRLVVTRGIGSLGIDPNKCQRPQMIIIVDKISLYSEDTYRDGMELVTAVTRRNSPETLNPRIKSLNYLNNILAKIEAIHTGYQEAIMLNQEGFVAECTGDNIFIVKKSKLATPSLKHGILDGITRRTVMDLANQLKIDVLEGTLTRHDLYNADECFLTGTAAGVVSVIKIDGRSIGTGKPGKITVDLSKMYFELTRTEGAPVAKALRA
jgi:branched-chain amino acid aminotransferase